MFRKLSFEFVRGGPAIAKMSILPQFLAYFEHLVVVVFVGLLVGVGVVCWLLFALLGGCWVHVGGSGGVAQGGLKPHREVFAEKVSRFRGKGRL